MVTVTGLQGNELVGQPRADDGCQIVFAGRGARLTIGSGVRLPGVVIRLADRAVVEIGDGSRLRGQLRAEADCAIRIGRGVQFNKPCRLHADEQRSIAVGDACLFANVRFRTSDAHSVIEVATGRRLNAAADIDIGPHVWIAENVLVYKGVRIGAGSIVAAGAIVTRSVPRQALAGGVPARVLRSGVTWRPERLPSSGAPA